MTDTTTTRRRNAALLHRRFLEEAIAAGLPAKGLDQAFAKKLEISPSMWSQIKSHRPIGDTLARQIEQHCGAEAGWLDREGTAAAAARPPDPAEERFVAAAREAWRRANAKGKRELRRMLLALPDAGKGRGQATVGGPPSPAPPGTAAQRHSGADALRAPTCRPTANPSRP